MHSMINTRRLLIVSAILEGAAGAAFALFPSACVFLLLGASTDPLVGNIIARGFGVALISLSAAYWLARKDAQGRVAKALVMAMLLYNFGFVLLLGYARISSGLNGIGQVPGIMVHSAIAIWCLIVLWRVPDKK